MADERTRREFNELHREWKGYYEGKVVHPTKDEEVSKEELRRYEISDIVETETNKLKEKIGKKAAKRQDLEPHVYELAENAYLSSIGAKNKKALDPEILRQNVRDFFVGLANRASPGRNIQTYDEAIEVILEAADPVHGTSEADRSAVLDSLLQNYADLTYVSKHEGTKGQSSRRLRYLIQELSHKGFKEHLERQYGDIFERYGRKGHKFDKTVEAGQILDVASEALTVDKIVGTTLRRKYVVSPKGPLKEDKPYQK